MLNITELKSRINLIDLIRQDVGRDKIKDLSHNNAVMHCVFHQEDTPSLRVSSTHYHCFGCGARGDGIDWLRKYRGLSFKDAVAYYGGQVIGPLKKREEPREVAVDSAARLEVSRINALLYNELIEDRARVEHEYITRRRVLGTYLGLPVAAYWPRGWEPKSISYEEGRLAGVAAVSMTGNWYWRFFDRVIFPTFSAGGNIMGFTGRNLTGENPKYICTPDTSLYRKKNCPYAFYNKTASSTYIIEGLIDAASFWCASGRFNVMSAQGVSSTVQPPEGTKALVLFDSDLPGIRGAYACANKIKGNCSVLLLSPRHKDINDAIMQESLTPAEIVDRCVRVDNINGLSLSLLSPTYSRALLDELAAPFVASNIEDGFPHYNSIDYLIFVYPEASKALLESVNTMKKNSKERDGVRLLRKQDIMHFLSCWAEICREVRLGQQ